MTSGGATRAPHPPASPPRRVENAPPARRRGPRSPGRMDHIHRRSRPRLRAPFQRHAHLCCEVSWVPACAGMTSDEATRAPHPHPSPPRRRGPRSPGRMGHAHRRARPRPRATLQRRAHLCCEVSWVPACAGMTSGGATRAPHPHPSPPRRVEDAPPARWRGARSPGRTGHVPRRARPRPRAPFQRRAHLCCEVSWVPACAGMTSREVPLQVRTVLRGEPVEPRPARPPFDGLRAEWVCDAGITSALDDRFAFHCSGAHMR